MKKLVASAVLALLALPAVAEEQCFGKVEVGDSVSRVLERCGEPVRREQKVTKAEGGVQIIRGLDSLHTQPLNPKVLERWYYDTGLDMATVIDIVDGGVSRVRRLVREKHQPLDRD